MRPRRQEHACVWVLLVSARLPREVETQPLADGESEYRTPSPKVAKEIEDTPPKALWLIKVSSSFKAFGARVVCKYGLRFGLEVVGHWAPCDF